MDVIGCHPITIQAVLQGLRVLIVQTGVCCLLRQLALSSAIVAVVVLSVSCAKYQWEWPYVGGGKHDACVYAVGTIGE